VRIRLAAVALALLAEEASGQSLGEAARKEKQRRESRVQASSSTPAKVFTDEDLAKYATETPSQPTTSPSASEPPGADTEDSRPPEEPTSFGRTEGYWRGRKRQLQRVVGRSEAEVTALERSG
jgi:hypothetical protein